MITIKELEQIKTSTLADNCLDDSRGSMRVVVGMATCGIAAGAKPVYDLLTEGYKGHGQRIG